jgi:adenine specific DNA methylase Mod
MAEIFYFKNNISLIYSRKTKISPISLPKNGKILPGKKNTSW